MKRPLPKNAILIPEYAKRVFEGKIFDVYQWEQGLFDGSTTTFEMLKRPDSVYVIAVDGDKIITLDEEQPNGVKRTDHFPAGRVEKSDKTVLDAAKREFAEETGLQFANWRLLEVMQPQHKIEWFIYTFLATQKIGKVPLQHEPGEKITIKRSDFATVKAKNSKYVTALQKSTTLEELLKFAA